MHAERIGLTRLVVGDDGPSRFEDATVDDAHHRIHDRKSSLQPARSLTLRWTPPSCGRAPHAAPRRQLAVILDGGVRLTDGQGESRDCRRGDLFEAADTWGDGHASQALDGRPFLVGLLTLDAEAGPRSHRPMSQPGAIPLLRVAARDYPEVSLRFVESYGAYMNEMRTAARIDVAILGAEMTLGALVPATPLLTDQMFLVGASDGVTAGRDDIFFHEIVELPLCLPTTANGLRAPLVRAAEGAG